MGCFSGAPHSLLSFFFFFFFKGTLFFLIFLIFLSSTFTTLFFAFAFVQGRDLTYTFFFYFWAVPRSMQDLSSWTRNRTHALCNGSLNHWTAKEGPLFSVLSIVLFQDLSLPPHSFRQITCPPSELALLYLSCYLYPVCLPDGIFPRSSLSNTNSDPTFPGKPFMAILIRIILWIVHFIHSLNTH